MVKKSKKWDRYRQKREDLFAALNYARNFRTLVNAWFDIVPKDLVFRKLHEKLESLVD